MDGLLTRTMERRASDWHRFQEITDAAESETRDLTVDDVAELEKLEAAIAKDTETVERLQRGAVLRSQFEHIDRSGAPAPGGDGAETPDPSGEYREAFVEMLRYGLSEMSPEQRAVLNAGRLSSEHRDQLRAQGVGTASAGGYLVPEEFRRQIIERQKQISSVRDVVTVIETSTGASMEWPTSDDTANKGAILAENTASTEQDVTLGTATLDAYMYTSKLVRVSLQLIQDSAFDVEDWLSAKLADRIARITNEHFTTGTGTAQPLGIQTNATSGVTAASATAITADELIDLAFSIDPAYRQGGNAKYMLSDAALKGVRKLKATDGQYLWQPSLQEGVPDRFFGYGYVINQDMPVPATGVKSVLFGDFRAAYVVRDVREFLLLSLRERYAEYLQTGFLGFSRHGGTVQDANAYRALTQA